MFTEDKITEIFCIADDFCNFFDAQMKKYTFKSDKKRQYHIIFIKKVLLGKCTGIGYKRWTVPRKGNLLYSKVFSSNSRYNKARKTYKKGYETKELINALDMSAIRNKRQDVLAPLENALGVVMS